MVPALALVAAGCGRIGFDPTGDLPPSDADAAVTCATREITATTLPAPGVTGPPALVVADAQLGLAYWNQPQAEIVFQRLQLDGAPTGLPTMLTGQAGNGAGQPSVAWTGTEFGVARLVGATTSTAGRIELTRLDPLGAPLAAAAIVTTHATTTGPARLAWNGTQYAATWVAFDPLVSMEQGGWFAPVAADGTRLGAGVRAANFGDCYCTLASAWSGAAWGVVFENDGLSGNVSNAVGFTRVAQDGATASAPVAVSGFVRGSDPRIAWTGAAFVVAWTHETGELFLALVDATGQPGPAVPRAGSHVVVDVVVDVASGVVLVAFADATGVWLWELDGALVPLREPGVIAAAPGVTKLSLAVADGVAYLAWQEPDAIGVARAACPP